MNTERRTLGLILLFAAAAWAAAGVLVTRYLPHLAALSDWVVVPEAAMFILLAVRVGLLGVRRSSPRADAVACGACVWEGTRQVCAC